MRYNLAKESVGTLFEFYNFPQTAFVANFAGKLNIVSAEVIGPASPTLSVEDLTVIVAQGLDGKQRSDQVVTAIFPERLNFVSFEKKANLLDCTLENISLLLLFVRMQVPIGACIF